MRTSDIDDAEFTDSTIEQVEQDGDGYAVTHDDGWVLWVDNPPVVPKVGDAFRTYGRGIGSPVRGIAINGEIVRYQTEAEHRAEFLRKQAERDDASKKTAIASRHETQKRIAALPTVFQDRINGFTGFNPDFEWQHLPYELFTCEQAVIIAAAFPDALEELKEWSRLGWDAQIARVPALSHDHSGNTFGAATRLAFHFLTDPTLVPKEHGALCPLVGCRDYGCPPARTEAAA